MAARSLIVMPDDTGKPILDAIEAAQESIRIKIFLFSEPTLLAGGDCRTSAWRHGSCDAESGTA